MKKLMGFTLNEVLITVGIIGVVAAITIPNVIANHQKQGFLVSLKKNYSELSQNLAVLSTEKYNKGMHRSKLRDIANIELFFKGNITGTIDGYYQIAKDCGVATTPCFAESYRSVESNTFSNFSCSNGYSVLLKSGSAMCITPEEIVEGSENNFYVTVNLDVNGDKKPNTGGRDMFTFTVNNKYEIQDNEDADDCTSSTIGEGCLAKILNDNWTVNY